MSSSPVAGKGKGKAHACARGTQSLAAVQKEESDSDLEESTPSRCVILACFILLFYYFFGFIYCGSNAALSSLRRLLESTSFIDDRADASAEVDSVGGDDDAEDTAEEDAVEGGTDGDDASHAGDEVRVQWS